MTARLPYNPRILAGPHEPCVAAEVARLVGPRPPTGGWVVALSGLNVRQGAELRRVAAACGGEAWLAPKGDGLTDAVAELPAAGLDAAIERLAATGGQAAPLAEALGATAAAWRRQAWTLRCGARALDVGRRTLVMGVVNVTPDSFSDGGRFLDTAAAIEQGRRLAEAGADILDIGGESTRPGAPSVGAEAECRRVVPVIEALAAEVGVPISIDTSKAEVARRALDAGATMLNDVTALRGEPAMARLAAEAAVPVAVMHMKGTPRTMQKDPRYDDLMGEIVAWLRASIAMAVDAGVAAEQVVVDPGIGFGKTVAHNLEILRRLPELRSLGRPILLGTSRKSFIGATLGTPVGERLLGTAATVAFGIERGAHIVRVHDVAEMRQVARMTDAMRG